MAPSRPAIERSQWKITQQLGDWLAPLIAFVVVVGILLALISVLLESAR